MTGGSCAIGGCEPCQAGNRAALSSLTDVPRGSLPRARHTAAHGKSSRVRGVWSDFVSRVYFCKNSASFGSAEICKILFSERFCLNGGHHVSGFIQKVETVVL